MSAPGGSALGGVWSWGVSALGGSALGGVWSQGGGGGACSKGGGSGPGGHLLRGGPPCWGGLLAGGGSPCQRPPLWTESQMPVKTLPWPNFVAAGNNVLSCDGGERDV